MRPGVLNRPTVESYQLNIVNITTISDSCQYILDHADKPQWKYLPNCDTVS
jgi:hypothetical protein